MKRISWKYIAGFVDGEGCLDMQSYHNDRAPSKMAGGASYIRPRVRIAQAMPGVFVIEQFKANFGGSMFVKNKGREKNPAWSESWLWDLTGRRVRPFLQNIVNHLYIKKEQARFMIWVIDNVMDKSVGPEARQAIRDEMSAMKSDPQRLSERAQERVMSLVTAIPWSKHSPVCLGCNSIEEKHYCRGYCGTCFAKIRNKLKPLAMRQSEQLTACML